MRAFSIWFALLAAFSVRGAITGLTPKSPSLDQTIHPRYVASDSAGNVWFTDERFTPHAVGYFDRAGKVTKFPVPCDKCATGEEIVYVYGLRPASDGVWFLYSQSKSDGSPINSFIGRVTTQGTFTSFPVPTAKAWQFYVNPSGHADLTFSPDGNLWFTENAAGKIGKMTQTGVITEYPLPSASSSPSGITAGPDGNVWFTMTSSGQIGRITPGGTITTFPVPGSSAPYGIVAGPDGNLWFTNATATGSLGRIAPNGTVTLFPIASANSFPQQIKLGPNRNLWFSLRGSREIARAKLNDGGGAPAIETAPTAQYPFDLAFRGQAPSGVTTNADQEQSDVYVTASDASFVDSLEGFTVTEVPCRLVSQGYHPFGPAFNPPDGANVAGYVGSEITAVVDLFSYKDHVFSVVAGTLPPGLSLNTARGGITGIPTQSGTFTATIRVSDPDQPGCSETLTFTAYIQPAACDDFHVNTGDSLVFRGLPANVPLVFVGGTPPYGIEVVKGFLPPGLTLSTSGVQGTVSRTTPLGAYPFEVEARDAAGCWYRAVLGLRVADLASPKRRAVNPGPH